MTLANLASGTGRVGAQKDWGLGSIEGRYSVRVRFRAATTPLVGGVIRVYLATAQDTAFITGGLPTTDALITNESKLANCQLLGEITVDEASTTKDFVADWVVRLDSRCVSPVVLNALGVSLDATPANNEVAIWPIVQGGGLPGLLIPGTIDATGATDVTVPLQAWLENVPDGSRILGPAGAIYRVEFGITLASRNGLTIEAQDPALPATLRQTVLEPYGVGHASNRNRHVLNVTLGGDHTIRDWRLHSAQPNSGYAGVYVASLEAQHGIELHSVVGFLAEDLYITEVAGDFLYVDKLPGAGTVIPDDITFRRITGRKASRQGLALSSGTHILLEDSDLQDITRSAIDIEPNVAGSVVQFVTVRNSTFGWFVNAWIAGQGSFGATITDLDFDGNTIVAVRPWLTIKGYQTWEAPYGEGRRRSNIRVVNNTSVITETNQNTSIPAFTFWGIDGLEVTGNTVDYQTAQTYDVGIQLAECCSVTASGNDFDNPDNEYEVATSYDANGEPVWELDPASLEWSLCGATVPQVAGLKLRAENVTVTQG